jgi:hypothetical protein
MRGDRTCGAASPLRDDQRGAIMIIGLFAALSLIGTLWFLVGVGTAVLTHDLGQEAADAAALSSATIHARAMNATASINFVMLVMVGAYLCFSVLCDVALAVAAHVMLFRPTQPQYGEAIGSLARDGYRMLISFEQNTGRTFASLHAAQTSLAVAGPYLGALAGNEVATNYKYMGMTMGWSNFPGASLPRKNEVRPFAEGGSVVPSPKGYYFKICAQKSFVCSMSAAYFPTLVAPPPFDLGTMGGSSLGLPVASEPAKAMCVRAGGVMFDTLADVLRLFSMSGISTSKLKLLGGTGAPLGIGIHCNDDVNQNIIAPQLAGTGRGRNVWSAMGPKRMTATNGDTVMRVVAWSVSPEETVPDESLRRVKLAAYHFTGTTDRHIPVYDAQAEFYYDCDAPWGDGTCNDGEIGRSGVGYEHALYWMKWRARLTRTRPVEEVFQGPTNRVIDLGGQVAAGGAMPSGVWPKVAYHLGRISPFRSFH